MSGMVTCPYCGRNNGTLTPEGQPPNEMVTCWNCGGKWYKNASQYANPVGKISDFIANLFSWVYNPNNPLTPPADSSQGGAIPAPNLFESAGIVLKSIFSNIVLLGIMIIIILFGWKEVFK